MSLASPPSGSTPHRKPRADLYTVMLLIALLALIAATIFLYCETLDYGSPPFKGAPQASILQVPASTAVAMHASLG
jgi:hypothetical protein